MSWFGTDLVAVACILGGASMSGAATLALLGSDYSTHSACAVEAGVDTHRIVITGSSGARSVVVTPRVNVRSQGSAEGCEADIGMESVMIHLDDQLRHLDDLDLHLESMDRALQLQMTDLDRALQVQVEGEDGRVPAELQARIEAEIRRRLNAEIRR